MHGVILSDVQAVWAPEGSMFPESRDAWVCKRLGIRTLGSDFLIPIDNRNVYMIVP